MDRITNLIGTLIGIIIAVAVMALLLALPTKLLWNWLVTDLFLFPEITVWQAMGLNALGSILFKGLSVTK